MDVILISLHVTCILHNIAEKFGIKQQSFTPLQYVWLSQYLAEKCWNLYNQISHPLIKMQVISFNKMGLVFKFQLIWWIKGYAECSKGKLNKCILKAIVDTVTWLKQ